MDTKIGEHKKAWEEETEKKCSCLKKILRPILVCMALSGCYNFSDLNYIAKNEDKKITAKYVFSIAYRILLLLTVIAVATKFTVTTIKKPEYKLMGILCIAWTLMLLAFLILSFKQTSRKCGHLTRSTLKPYTFSNADVTSASSNPGFLKSFCVQHGNTHMANFAAIQMLDAFILTETMH